MKILLDMNIPYIWKEFFTNEGYKATHWSEVGNIRAEDTEIMEWARVNQYMVFTHDLDFGALLYATNAKEPSVVQLRVENILPSAIGNVVLETLQTVSKEIKNGVLITIDPRRRRIRLLPLKTDS
jgi:predicted nuclease of predicted toxin-antitoxin system